MGLRKEILVRVLGFGVGGLGFGDWGLDKDYIELIYVVF
jgi:hypothetical protein